MFTGLIEHLGTVLSIVLDEGGCTLTIGDAAPILVDCHIGDSIAVNGACLTVTAFEKEEKGGWFTVWLANETLERTDLGERKEGDQLNLERAMGAHVRFGGHFVQAHVDGTATIVSRVPDGDSLRLSFQLPAHPSLLPYLIPKGYVTIDGASLTVTKVDDAQSTFDVMLIQHTQTKITLPKKAIGAKVNIEVDMVGKYVEKSVLAALGGEGVRGLVEKAVDAALIMSCSVNRSPWMPVQSQLTSDVPLRPRAKINSSAQPRKTPSAAPTPRALSPKLKPPPKSTPTTPHARTRSTLLDGRYSPSPSVRIKSKVTPIVKSESLSPPTLYPITTATPAANPHRYAHRSPPQSASYIYQSFRGPDPPIPPTHSPPASTLSYSSRSSVTRSSESQNGDDEQLRSTLTNLLCSPDSDALTDDDDSAQNLKAEAKSNRKIADLEITNRSLLAINASLESTKHKQSKEIRDLRRKLRESRLILPPRAFRAVNDDDSSGTDESDEDEEEEEEDDSKDEVYVRIKTILDNLLETGRRALESQPGDFVQGSKGGAKVLSADEVRSWEGEDPNTKEEIDPSHIAVPDGETDSLDSEDEVERTLVHSTPSPPPIRISKAKG